MVTNDLNSKDLVIQLSLKSQQSPLLLLVKEGTKPNFYFNSTADSYYIETDYYDFQAWIQNSNNSYVTIKQDDLTIGSIFYIGIYSEKLGISYLISKYSKINNDACLPECISASYSECTNGACICSGNSTGYDCSILYTIANFDDNSTYSLTPNQWNFFIIDCRDTYGFTMNIKKYGGDPKFYFAPFYSDLYLPSMFVESFYLSFGESKLQLSKDYSDNQWAYWTYSVFCHGENNCEFSINIDDFSQSLSPKLIWWIAVIAIISFLLCILFPFAIKAMSRNSWARMAQTNEEGHASPLTPEEMEQLFPSIEWEKLGKEKETCAVCLEDFEDNAKVRQLICEHVFHVCCIDEWTKTKAKCPLCKKILKDQEIRIDLELVRLSSQDENLIRENQESEESKEQEEESLQSGEDEKNIEEECLNENKEENEILKETDIDGYEIGERNKKKGFENVSDEEIMLN